MSWPHSDSVTIAATDATAAAGYSDVARLDWTDLIAIFVWERISKLMAVNAAH